MLLLTVAVFVTVPPPLVLRTRLNVAPAPLASNAMLQVTAPVPPAAGVAQVKAGPPVWLAETNVVPAGSVSLSCTFCASRGPLLVTAI